MNATATMIYEVPGYALSVSGDTATLTNGTRKQEIPLRHGSDEIPSGIASALKKAGQKPEDYFAVAGRAVIRRPALAAWTAAVEARIAERHAEKARKDADTAREIAAAGQRALILHGGYLLNSSLAFVRPMSQKEAEKFAPEFRATGMVALGEWKSIRAEVAQRFLANRARKNDGWVPGQESVVILVSEAEWDSLVSGENQAVEAEKSAKEAERKEAEESIEAVRKQAVATGEPVELDRVMDDCDGSERDCSFDLIRRMIRPDGSVFTIRTHCH